jgi:Flp pilus assembly pilin Flp
MACTLTTGSAAPRSGRSGSTRWCRSFGQRGATLAEYALVVALLVVVTISATEYLTDESAEVLADNGSQIGEPRDYGIQIVTTTQPAPPEWAITTVPQDGETLYDTEIRHDGDCLYFVSRLLEEGQCDGSLATVYSLENWEDDVYRITTAQTLECWEAAGRTRAPVLPSACAGEDDELWLVTKLDDYRFTIESTFSGYCADIATGTLEEAVCSPLSETQIFTLPGSEESG